MLLLLPTNGRDEVSEDVETKSFWDDFFNETKLIEFLFELYDKYTSGMFVKDKKKEKIILHCNEHI